MQTVSASPTSPVQAQQSPHQHSPKRSSPLSQPFSTLCDTSDIAAPSTPSSANNAQPLTPPDSLSRSGTSISSIASSSPHATSTSSLSITSALSATAPHFQSRILDAPIDIHYLASANNDAGSTALSASELESSSAASAAPDTSSTMPSVPRATNGPASVASSTKTDSQADDIRTPNVYINGLPPNFPEEQLFAMTRDFGEVLSVRTFTRHVSDKPSGYGFVLFGDVDAAERCIETLRKYRNLHPSFSKQIHKIPGTVYASPSFNTSNDASTQSLAQRLPADSFKARMEQLKDTTSTNLYMEGLPLSIDEPTLSALVAPYRIMSSRFFQTRLSNPPRIIAFVRLETRKAAEEIIERLHGRLVRGWQDAGCRISVRFADTSEQREIRRTERLTRDGENSPSRLTMAQAALLNMKGAQLPRSPVDPTFGLLPNGGNVESVLLSDNYLRGQTHDSSLSPLAHATAAMPFQQQQMFNSVQDPQLLLGSQGSLYDDLDPHASQYLQGMHVPQLLQNDMLSLNGTQPQFQLAMDMQNLATRADNGYTPMERLILEGYLQRHQSELLNVQRDVAARTQLPSQSRGPLSTGFGRNTREPRRLLDVLPPMSEDDFHSSAVGVSGRLQPHSAFTELTRGRDGDSTGTNGMLAGAVSRTSAEQSSGLAFDFDPQFSLSSSSYQQQQYQHQRNQTHASQARTDAAQALHTRATTLPSQYLSSRDSSKSFLNSNFNSSNVCASPTIPGFSNSNSVNNLASSIGHGLRLAASGRDGAPTSSAFMRPAGRSRSGSLAQPSAGADASSAFTSRSNVNVRSAARGDEEESDGGMVSPALTYSTNGRTPASLSPATPFSGFFPGTGDAFEGPGPAAELGEKALGKARA